MADSQSNAPLPAHSGDATTAGSFRVEHPGRWRDGRADGIRMFREAACA